MKKAELEEALTKAEKSRVRYKNKASKLKVSVEEAVDELETLAAELDLLKAELAEKEEKIEYYKNRIHSVLEAKELERQKLAILSGPKAMPNKRFEESSTDMYDKLKAAVEKYKSENNHLRKENAELKLRVAQIEE